MSGRVDIGDYVERAHDKKDCQLSFIVKTKIWAADSAHSWYYNANGNMNNNNKNNSNTVRAVSEFHQEGLISLEDVFEAYYDCRKIRGIPPMRYCLRLIMNAILSNFGEI